MWTTLGTSINDSTFFSERPFTLTPKFSQKWITRCKNTLRRWGKDDIEAKNMDFHLAYLGNRYQNFQLFRRTTLYLIAQIFPEMDYSEEEHATEMR